MPTIRENYLTRAAACRGRADEMLAKADQVHSPDARDDFLVLARQWVDLAHQLERMATF